MSGLVEVHTEELEAVKKAIASTLQDANIELLYGSPVDASVLPDYHEVIKHPKDLGTILSDVETSLDGDGPYKNANEVLKDVHLVWSNCFLYNNRPVDAAIRKLCRSSIKIFEQEWRKAGISIDPSYKKSSPSKLKATQAGRPLLQPGESSTVTETLSIKHLTNFEVRSPSSGHALQGLEHLEAERNAGSTLAITGTIVPDPQAQGTASESPQKTPLPASTLLSNEPIIDWAIEYTPKGSFNMWIATQSAWLKLLQPSERYSQLYQHAVDCAAFTAQILKDLPLEDAGIDLAAFIDRALSMARKEGHQSVSNEMRRFAIMQLEAKLGRRRPRPGSYRKRKQGIIPGTGKRPRGMSKTASKGRLGSDTVMAEAFFAGDAIDAISDDDMPDDFEITSEEVLEEVERENKDKDKENAEAMDPEIARRKAWKRFKYWQQRVDAEERQRRAAAQRRRRESEADNARGAPPPMTTSFRLPPQCIPDVLMVWEFVHAFGDVLQIAPFSLAALEAALLPGPRVPYKDELVKAALLKEAEEEEKEQQQKAKGDGRKGDGDDHDDEENKDIDGDVCMGNGVEDTTRDDVKREIEEGGGSGNGDGQDGGIRRQYKAAAPGMEENENIKESESIKEANRNRVNDTTNDNDTTIGTASAAATVEDQGKHVDDDPVAGTEKEGNKESELKEKTTKDADNITKDEGDKPAQPPVKRKRGRPPGSKNKTTLAAQAAGASGQWTGKGPNAAPQNIIDNPTVKTRGQRGIPTLSPRRSDMIPSILAKASKGGKGRGQLSPKSKSEVAAALSAAQRQQERFSSVLKRKYAMTADDVRKMLPIDREYACSSVLLRDLVCALSRAVAGSIDPENNRGTIPRSAKATHPSNEHPPWTERAAIAVWSAPTSGQDARMAALKLTYGDFVDLTVEERVELLVAMVHAALSSEKMVAEVNARLDKMNAEMTRRDGGAADEMDDEDGRLAAAAAAAVIVPPPPPPALPGMMDDGAPPLPPPPTSLELWQRWIDAQHIGIRRSLGVDFRGRKYWVLGRHAGAFRVYCQESPMQIAGDGQQSADEQAADVGMAHNSGDGCVIDPFAISPSLQQNQASASPLPSWGWYEGTSLADLIEWLSKASISCESSLISVLRAMPSPVSLHPSSALTTPSKRPESVELAAQRADGYKGLNLPLLCGEGNARTTLSTTMTAEAKMAQAVEALLGAIPLWFRQEQESSAHDYAALGDAKRPSLLQTFFAIDEVISSSSAGSHDAALALLETEHLLCHAGRLSTEWMDVWRIQWRHYVLNHADHKDLPLCVASLQSHVRMVPDIIPRQAFLKVATDINYSLTIPSLGDVVVVLRTGLLLHVDRYIELLRVKAPSIDEQQLQQQQQLQQSGYDEHCDAEEEKLDGSRGPISTATAATDSNREESEGDDAEVGRLQSGARSVRQDKKSRGRKGKRGRPKRSDVAVAGESEDVGEEDNDDDDEEQRLNQRPKSATDHRRLAYLPAPMILESSLPRIEHQWNALREDIAALRPVERFVVRGIVYRRHLADDDDTSKDSISEASPRIPVAWLCLRPAKNGPHHQLPSKDIVVPLALVLNLPDYLMPVDTYAERSKIAWQQDDRFRIFIGGKISAKTQKKVKSGGIWKKGTVVEALSSVPGRHASLEEKETYDPWASLVIAWDSSAVGQTETANPWEIEIDPEEENRKADDARRAQQAAARALRARASARRDPGDPSYAEQAAECDQEDEQLAELTRQGERASYLLNIYASKHVASPDDSVFNETVYGAHAAKPQQILAESSGHSVSEINAAAASIGLHAASTSFASPQYGVGSQLSSLTLSATQPSSQHALLQQPSTAAHLPAPIPSAPLYQGQEISRDILDALLELSPGQFTTLVSNFYRGYRGKYKIPTFAHRELDIFKVWWCVMDRGGYEMVTNGKLWKDVCRSMDLNLSGQTSASYNMRMNYERCLLDFENYLASGRYGEDLEGGRAPVHTHALENLSAGYYVVAPVKRGGSEKKEKSRKMGGDDDGDDADGDDDDEKNVKEHDMEGGC